MAKKSGSSEVEVSSSDRTTAETLRKQRTTARLLRTSKVFVDARDEGLEGIGLTLSFPRKKTPKNSDVPDKS